ncbi:MAG: TonB-dependent receptor [Cytophagales bacterium]|nr:TonB-dependent receptor [Cytophagales bacterium]
MKSACSKTIGVLASAGILFSAHAQQRADSLRPDSMRHYDLQEVVVTATRNERGLAALPMPVTVVSGKQIRQMGSLRLNEVLQEQTGLAIINDHGNGLQMQGFSPDYTLILVDGEPLIGRTAGTLELSRIAVGNIRQIEIVKGPSSSLYGSEAMGGVVNIITERPEGTRGSLRTRYGTNRTSDLTGDVSLKRKRLGLYAFANRYRTGGYDFSPETFGQTVEPFANHTLNARATYRFAPTAKLTVSGRYFAETQRSGFNIGSAGSPELVTGNGTVRDWNLNPVLDVRFSPRWKADFRFYASRYGTRSEQRFTADGRMYDETFFDQTFVRPEVVAEFAPNPKHTLTFGAGHIAESVEATRYPDKRRFGAWYGLFQHQWLPTEKWNVILGGRLDRHSVYGSQFNPKLSAQYELTRWLAVRASAGRGFKAPDFRQLYLNFNNAVAGYSVFGTEELAAGLSRLEAGGRIAQVLLDPAQFGNLRAESSTAYNFGFRFSPLPTVKGNVNFFRNSIRDLIETQAVARLDNGQSVFSYRNLSRVYTQGLETDWSYKIHNNVSLSAGYQLLFTADEAVLAGIEAGQYFRRDPETLVTTRVGRRQYGGLFNRSRHMGNVKLFYENPKNGFSGSVRGVYRGRYGVGDFNGNLILDDDSEYVRGFFQWNVAVAKTYKSLTLQAGVDNVFNFRNTQFMPGIPGRLLYASLGYEFSKKDKKMPETE